MPRYAYECALHHRLDQVRTIDDRDTPKLCPVCDEAKVCTPLQRDVIGSMPVHTTEKEYEKPIFSDALGVHPSQINEAKQKFPHHEFTPDGRMILRSHTQRNRAMKDLGYHDKDGYN